MQLRDTALLRHQQQRFMRSDAARYMRPDAARYLTPERKSDGQPRLPEGQSDGGQYTFNERFDGIADSSGRPRVYITRTEGTGDAGSGGDGDAANDGVGNGLDNVWLAASPLLGASHNGGPPLEDPPEIPELKPSGSSDRTAFARGAANWITAALGAGAGIAAAGFIGLLNNIDWLQGYQSAIKSYRDPPRTLEELQRGVGQGRPGYEDHHIIEQTAAQKWGLSRSEINDRSNVVSIPRLKHYQITGRFTKKSGEYGGLSPREYLSDKSPKERRRVGLNALIDLGVLQAMKRADLSGVSTNDLVQLFEQIGLAQDQADRANATARYNRLYDSMAEVSTELKHREGDQRRALRALYESNNMQVRLQSAIHTLAVFPDDALKALQLISSSKWYPQAADASSMMRSVREGFFKPN